MGKIHYFFCMIIAFILVSFLVAPFADAKGKNEGHRPRRVISHSKTGRTKIRRKSH